MTAAALAVALAHADQGRHVFPFRLSKVPGSTRLEKRPLVKWKDVATTDPDQITAWASKWPTARFGWCLEEGLVVVDIDDESAFAATGHALPQTASQSTPSGGSHHLFAGVGVRQSVKAIPGMDTRVGGKGWVGLYAADSFTGPVAIVPDWLLDQTDREGAPKWEEPTEDAPLTSHEAIVTWAGRMRSTGMSGADILTALLAAYGDGRITESDPSRPWSKQDLTAIATEMGSKPAGERVSEHVVRFTTRKDRAPVVEHVAFTADSLLAADIPDLQWVIPDILPEGTTLIVSPPKIGKSALVLQVAVALQTGVGVLDRKPERLRPVLYFALEDGERRMQGRLKANLGNRPKPLPRLEISLTAPSIGAGLEETLSNYYDDNADGVVILDTLQHVRPIHKSGRGAYEMDVMDLRALRDVVRNRSGASLVIVHHTNKPNEESDFVAAVSGTYGLSGTTDTILRVIRKRHDPHGRLEVAGRDVPEIDIPVIYEDLLWSVDPDGPPLPGQSRVRNDIALWLAENGPAWPAEVAAGLGMERSAVSHRMTSMADTGELLKDRAGYNVAIPVNTVPRVPQRDDSVRLHAEEGRGTVVPESDPSNRKPQSRRIIE